MKVGAFFLLLVMLTSSGKLKKNRYMAKPARLRRHPPASIVLHAHIFVTQLSSVDQLTKIWLPRQRPWTDRTTIFGFIIYIHRSSNSAKLAKIGSASLDVEILGLREFVDK